jgi:hypothetical protein
VSAPSVHGAGPTEAPPAPALPPVAHIAVLSMALVIAGGIYMGSHLPAKASLGVPIGLLVASGVLVLVNVAQLARLREFSWSTFRLVGKWALVAYLVITGLLEYVFVLDGTRGSALVVLTVSLAIFAVDVPVLLAFSVARYQPVEQRR